MPDIHIHSHLALKLTTHLERRDSDSNDLRVAVRDADSGILDTRLGSSSLGVAVEHDGRGASLGVDDLNVLERSAGALALDLQALEDGLLGAPAASERGLGVGLGTAVGDLLLGEVALDEGVVVDVKRVDALDVDTGVGVGRGVDLIRFSTISVVLLS